MPRPDVSISSHTARRSPALALVPLLGVGLVVASCADVLGIEYNDTAEELCELLEQCYGADHLPGCADRVGNNLDNRSEQDTKNFLDSYGANGCTESCTAARDCLDEKPVCEPIGFFCSAKEECCDFVSGLSTCGPNQGCCRPRGTRCGAALDCCDADCLEPTSEALGTIGERFCGGFECVPGGEPCDDIRPCCTLVCVDGTCSDQICRQDGPCTNDAECCSGVCNGTCEGQTRCSEAEESCAQNDCCEGLTCYRSEQDETCLDCLDDASDCQNNDQCCSGFCDAGTCTTAGCFPPGSECSDLSQCCNEEGSSTTCLKVDPSSPTGFCTEVCDDAPSTSCDVCVAGERLSPECGSDGDPGRDCILDVCQDDPFCCCVEWDSVCVADASQRCGLCG